MDCFPPASRAVAMTLGGGMGANRRQGAPCPFSKERTLAPPLFSTERTLPLPLFSKGGIYRHPFSVIASGGTPRGNPALDDI